MPRNDRTVSIRVDGTWANKKNGNDRASVLHETQRETENAARKMLHNSRGGELKEKNEGGKIRSTDKIAPGNDPLPPRDREH